MTEQIDMTVAAKAAEGFAQAAKAFQLVAQAFSTALDTPTTETAHPAKPEPSPEPAQPQEVPRAAVSLEDARKALSEQVKAGNAAKVKELLTDHFGVTKLSDLPADKYAELINLTEQWGQ